MAFFLVTGGAGFIGSHVVELLVDSGHAVRVLDNFSTGKLENLRHLADRIDIVEGDIISRDNVVAAVASVDFVIHLAAVVSMQRTIEDPSGTSLTNIQGSLHILQAARDARVRRVVYASSCALYGNDSNLPSAESRLPVALSPYALQKLTVEKYCWLFSRLYGLQVTALRYFNVYGPRQDVHSPYSAVIPRFISGLLKEEQPIIYGDGLQSRDFVFVKDVAWATVAAAYAKTANEVAINIASGRGCTILRLLELLQAECNTQISPQFAPPRLGDIRYSLADIKNAETILGYHPEYDIKEGLKIAVEWYRTAGINNGQDIPGDRQTGRN